MTLSLKNSIALKPYDCLSIPFSPESFAEGGSLVDKIKGHGEEIR